VAVSLVALMAALVAPAPARAAAPDPIDREVTCLTDNVSAGLPAVLKLSWRNTSKNAVELHAAGPKAVTVEGGAGGAARRLVLPAADLGTVTLDAGKTVSSTFLLVAGRPEGKADAPLEPIFPAAGKYQVTIDGFPTDGPLAITVAEPTAQEDRDARKNWTPLITACLAGDVAQAKDSTLELHVWQILVLQEKGPYAGYALWAKARGFAGIAAAHPDDAAANRTRRDTAMKVCKLVLDGHPETPVQESALELQVELAQAMGRVDEGRQLAQKLAEKFPAGLAVARLRQAYGAGFEKLGEAPTPPGTVTTSTTAAGSVPGTVTITTTAMTITTTTATTTAAGAASTSPKAAPSAPPFTLGAAGPVPAASILVRDLPKQFVNWHISDGQHDRMPYEEVKKQIAAGAKVTENQSGWTHHTAVVMGVNHEQLLITGQIHLLLGEGPEAKPIDRRVRIMLTADDQGGMILKDVKVTDETPLLPAGGSTHVGPPPPVGPRG
jgi:hypothetical protein